tara:strand:- start:772 stop:1194 length:423 start_codon:yes stop_codon:yes gene_type:complete
MERNALGQFVAAETKVESYWERVAIATKRAQFETIRHAAFGILRYAKGLIKKSDEPSAKGDPPTTRGYGGKNLKAAIWADIESDSAFVGPRASIVGDVGEAHEFGVKRRGDTFDERPFMGPALMANQDSFADDWRGRIGE